MPAAILAPDARRDLRHVVRTIARDSLSASRRFPEAVSAMAQRIADYPNMGVERSYLAQTRYRFATIQGFPHVAIYDPSLKPPVILRIVHGAQDLKNLVMDLSQRKAD